MSDRSEKSPRFRFPLSDSTSVTVLPSVGSLQALRELPPSQAREPYIGFGNPLLVGPSGINKSA
jgi:hypothetical protein